MVFCKRTFICGTTTSTWGADVLVGVQFKKLPVAFCLLLELPKTESNFIYVALVISLFVITWKSSFLTNVFIKKKCLNCLLSKVLTQIIGIVKFT